MSRYPQSEAHKLIGDLAHAAGVPHLDASILADALMDADLQGTSTHGISRLSIYLERMQQGLIEPDATLRIDRHSGSILAVDAANGLGQVQARKTLDLLTPLAKQNGIAAATIRNSQHFGTLSYYCNLAAAQGMILLAMTNCEPAMSPEGSSQAFFGTNPIAASFPTGKGYPIKIDLSTSTIARGNIIAAQKKNAPIPLGWALDRDGEPTTDANEALLGTVLTMAGHKGYALALMVELFSGVLSGSAIGPAVGSMYKNMDRKQDVGHFFCLLNIASFMGYKDFIHRIDSTIDQIKATQKRPDIGEILVPGERSARNAATNRDRGILISQETVLELQHWCSRLQIPFDMQEAVSTICQTS